MNKFQLKVQNQRDSSPVEEYSNDEALIGRELRDMKRLTLLPLPAIVAWQVIGKGHANNQRNQTEY